MKSLHRRAQYMLDKGKSRDKIPAMPKRSSSNKGTDPNLAAYRAVQHVIAMSEGAAATGKNPAAVLLGRLGGLKGGKARAASLSPKRKAAIARKAALARWKKTS